LSNLPTFGIGATRTAIMSGSRRQHCWRVSTTLLMIFMIVVDQVRVSECLLRGRRASYIGRHHRSTDDRLTYRPTVVDDRGSPFNHRRRLPFHLRNIASVDRRSAAQHRGDDAVARTNEIGQGHAEVSRGEELGQGRREGAEVKYGEVSSSRQLENYVSLDSRGDFKLFWDVDSVTETIQFRLVANVNKDDLVAFGFSAYGEPQDADFCVIWTNLDGRHLFQVNFYRGIGIITSVLASA